MTTLSDYQDFVTQTSRVKEKYWYACLGIAGESGEVIEHIKKIVRDENYTVSEKRREQLKLEIGDVLWYITRLANDLELSLDEILDANIQKLIDRVRNGKQTG